MMNEFLGNKITEITDKGQTVLVQYYAEWCGPCQMLKPILEQIAKEMHNVIFYRVDIEQHRELAIGEGVQSIPTMVLYKDGKEIAREAGFKPKHLVEAWINANN